MCTRLRLVWGQNKLFLDKLQYVWLIHKARQILDFVVVVVSAFIDYINI